MLSGFKTRCKNFIVKLKLHKAFSFLIRPALLISNTLKFSKWIAETKTDNNKDSLALLNREDLYALVNKTYVANEEITYLEFGVFKGDSMKWWLNAHTNSNSSFYGFDTFEGLPEKWGDYKKGAFETNIPDIADPRVHFIKGLFQDTLPPFLKELHSNKRLLIHVDADLFSSTLFVLTTLSPFLKKGDLILFDEFFVPNDEFSAFEIFCRSYYVKYELLGATKHYFRVAVRIIA